MKSIENIWKRFLLLLSRTISSQTKLILILSIASLFPTQVTALHLAAWKKTSVPVVSALLEAGSDPNVRDSEQSSALHWAAVYNAQIIPVMIQHGAEVNLLDCYNSSPLYRAAVNNNRDAVVALCNAGGDPRLGDNPLTHSRVREDTKQIIKKYL